MKLKVGEVEFDIQFKTLFAEYNCSTKMVGRGSIEVHKNNNRDDSWSYGPDASFLVGFITENKKALLTEWLESLGSPDTFKELKSGNPFFQGDQGRYIPSVLIYSDTATKYAYQAQWWGSSIKGAIAEFQNDPSYGVRVEESSLFQNHFYQGPHPAKVWLIFPPYMKDKLYVEGIDKKVIKKYIPFLGHSSTYYNNKDIDVMKKFAS